MQRSRYRGLQRNGSPGLGASGQDPVLYELTSKLLQGGCIGVDYSSHASALACWAITLSQARLRLLARHGCYDQAMISDVSKNQVQARKKNEQPQFGP